MLLQMALFHPFFMTKILNPELELHVPKLSAYDPLQSSALEAPWDYCCHTIVGPCPRRCVEDSFSGRIQMCTECKLFIQALLSFLGPGNTFRGIPSTIVIQKKKGVVHYTQLILSKVLLNGITS